MDLASIKPHSRALDILHPATGDKTGVQFEIVHPDHKNVKFIAEKNRREIEGLRKSGALISDDVTERHNLSLFASTVVGWTWPEGFTFNGEVPAYSQSTVESVLRDLEWIYKQVIAASQNEQAFFAQFADS